jgi:hypothetical protein
MNNHYKVGDQHDKQVKYFQMEVIGFLRVIGVCFYLVGNFIKTKLLL